ncbi:MAG: T9SS type A sorting domain-containing protein [Bacteroidales bacterium]|nr:T9SS type A sorting domain-containing protein [Bacteroidales bacterium]
MKKLLLISFSFLFIVNLAKSQSVTLSSPANGSIVSGVSISIYWNGINGSTYYDYQYDTVSTFNSPAVKTASRSSSYNYVTISDLYYGKKYYWRVRARNANDTTVWCAPWTFTTPATMSLSTPANYATINTVSPTLYYNTITGSSYYDYQLDTTPGFNSPSLITGNRSSSYNYAYVYNLRWGTTYYWHMRARDSKDTTAWTPTWQFTTFSPTMTLTTPANGSLVNGVSTTLYWNDVNGCTYYDSQYDTVPTFNSPVLKSGNRSSSYDYVSISNLYYGKTYYWHVRARNSNDTTAWSATWTFTTQGTMSLSSPANYATINSVSPTLYYNTITGSSYYDYQIDTMTSFNSPLLITGSRSSSYNYINTSNLRYGTTYYWHVRARDGVDTSAWTQTWQFTTFSPVMTLSSPANGSRVNGVTTTLYWNTIAGSTYYDYQYDTVPTFNSPVLKSGNRSSSYDYASISNLYYGKTYYWHVRARNSNDTTAWSATWTFTTQGTMSLSSPANSATINSVSPTLYYNTITGSNYYDYQIDTVPTFNSPELKTGNRSSSYNYINISNLRYGTTYYWRVRARDGVDTSAWTQTWRFTTFLPSMTLSSPANGSHVNGVTTTLYWNTIAGSTYYDYQYDTVATFNSPVLKSGNKTSSYDYVSISNLYYGQKYYWRVRARNSNDTTAWSATWTFTTQDTMSLSSPANYATINSVSPTLYYNTITGSNYYDYQIDTVPTFNSPALISGNRSSSYNYIYTSNLRYGTTYYWRVRARDGVDTSAWTQTWQFNTFLPAMTLSSPANGSHVNGVTTTLYWNTIAGSTYYDYQYDTVATFNSPVLKSGNKSSSYDYVSISNLFYGQKYYWRARARNSNDTTAWSATWTFTTQDTMSLSTPANYATINSVSPTLYYNTITGSNYYDYQIDTVPTFNSPALISGNRSSSYNYISISNLRYGTTYYWRMRARDAVDTSVWTQTWQFTTFAPVMTLSSPANGSHVNGVTTTLYWNTIAGSTYYDYQYDTVATFNSPVLKSGNKTSSYDYVSIVNLYYGKKYYWRARARNSLDTTAWSATWTFTTQDTMSLSSPANGAIVNSVSPYLYWNTIYGSNYYDYQVDTTPNFNSPILINGSRSSSYDYVNVSGLLYGTTYYWRVRARDAVDTSDWTAIWVFNTTYYLTTPPTLISPPDQSTQIPLNGQNFVWSSVPDIVGYELQYSTNNSFAGATSLTTPNTSTVINGFASNTTYYWRVRAYDFNGYSAWTPAWSFTTENMSIYHTITVTSCDSCFWNGKTYYQTGIYNDTLTSIQGYDSIVSMDLTINHTIYKDIYATDCDSFRWNTLTYYSSGNYTQGFYAQNSCDSLVTLHLTITNSDSTSFYKTDCDSCVWNGITYKSSGTYTQKFSNASGCDSVAIMFLTINNAYTISKTLAICETALPYYSAEYDTTFGVGTPALSTHQFKHTASTGCDSIVTLTLTVNKDVTYEFFANNCDSFPWNDSIYYQSGSYIQHFVSATGCDSAVTLHLTISKSKTHSFSATDCDSLVWNNITYHQSGVYTQHFTTAENCDSAVTVTLTLNHTQTTTKTLQLCESDLPYYSAEFDTTFGIGTPASSTYKFYHTASTGCDSIVTLILTISAVSSEITYGTDNSILVCTTPSASYQWLDCANGYQAIEGATADTLKPATSGSYAVVTGIGSCIDTSDCLEVVVKPDFVNELNDYDIICYPNPTNGFVILEGLTERMIIKVCDIVGRVIQSSPAKTEKMEIDLSAYEDGVYIFIIFNGEDKIVKRIIKN